MSLTTDQTKMLERIAKLDMPPIPDLPTFDDIDAASFAAGLRFARSISSFFATNASILSARKALSGQYPEEMSDPVPDQIVALNVNNITVGAAFNKFATAADAIATLRGIQATAKKAASA